MTIPGKIYIANIDIWGEMYDPNYIFMVHEINDENNILVYEFSENRYRNIQMPHYQFEILYVEIK
mgnify:CR=1 FL=1